MVLCRIPRNRADCLEHKAGFLRCRSERSTVAESAAAAGLAAFHIRGQGREVRGLEMRSKLAFRLKSPCFQIQQSLSISRLSFMDTTFKTPATPVSLLAVVVLYKTRPTDSISLRTLMQSASQVRGDSLNLRVLLYDNSPNAASDDNEVPNGVRIFRATRNAGLANAYNYALELAQAEGCNWLLTLDQDTSLPMHALARLTALAQQFQDREDVAAIVPELIEREIVQSPLYVQRRHRRRMQIGYCGFPESEITVMNSCTMWNVRHLMEIGGFDRDFWLDYLDYVMCHRTFRSGRKIYVAGDIRVEHQLSLANWKDRMSPERLQNILAAESAFNDLYKSPVDRLLLTMKLLALFCTRTLKREDSRFLRIIRREMFRRLFESRKIRLAEWRTSAQLKNQNGWKESENAQ